MIIAPLYGTWTENGPWAFSSKTAASLPIARLVAVSPHLHQSTTRGVDFKFKLILDDTERLKIISGVEVYIYYFFFW